MTVSFAQLGVPEKIVKALDKRGITEPFEIQAATIADALEGRDVCGRAPTGSGKTIAFGIPLVARVGRAESRRPRALVLAPTRELAEQITSELRAFSGSVRIGAVYGGVGYGPQYNALRQGVDILVACPGRLEDLIAQKALKLDDVELVVLDEADRMADMGFMPAVRRLLDQTADDRQTMLYSATLDGDVAKLTADYQKSPVRHEVGEETPDIRSATHVFWKVNRASRNQDLADAVNAVWPAIIFCRTRHGSDRVAKQLEEVGIKAGSIHGGRSQGQRTRALAAFASGKVQVLVASDVAARGIHVDNIAMVVHFDPPDDHKTYVHRSGRTARAGQSGIVLSTVLPEQAGDARRMQRRLGIDSAFVAPDAVALREMSPTPVRKAPARKPQPVVATANIESEVPSGKLARPEQSERKPYSSPKQSTRPEQSERKPYSRPEKFAHPEQSEHTPYSHPKQVARQGQSERTPYSRPKQFARPEQSERRPYSQPERSERKPYAGSSNSEYKPNWQANKNRKGPGVKAFTKKRSFDAVPQERETAPRSRPEATPEQSTGGSQPWQARKANQFSRSRVSGGKGASTLPYASGPQTKSRRRAAHRAGATK